MFDALLLDIDRLPYEKCLALMKNLVSARQTNQITDTLILTEHEPVLTLGRRAKQSDILVSPHAMQKMNIKSHDVERGGQVTYHGPGQLMVYPIFNLKSMNLGVAAFVNLLEEAIIKTLAGFGVSSTRIPGKPGIWAGDSKIASIGLAVRKHVAFHGAAINNNPRLEHFQLINPCGEQKLCMTSVAHVLGKGANINELRHSAAGNMADIFKLNLKQWTLNQAGRVMAA